MTTEEMRRLRDKGLTYQAIADKAGTSRQEVHARLNYYGTDEYRAKKLKEYHNRKANQ